MKNFESLVDLGCSIGTWYNDFRNFGFKHITGIDISEERASKAKERGYDEVHVCNAYDLPFDDESKNCVISNDVFVHVIQEDDKLKIINEVYRILKKNGIFIFNFGHSQGYGHVDNKTIGHCRHCTLTTIKNLINNTKFKIEFVLPCYYTILRIGANPIFVSFFSRLVFPNMDKFLKNMNNFSSAKVIYFGLRK